MCLGVFKTLQLSLTCLRDILGKLHFLHILRVYRMALAYSFTYLQIYRKALVDSFTYIEYIKGALSNDSTLDNACTKMNSHVPRVYRENPWQPETYRVNYRPSFSP